MTEAVKTKTYADFILPPSVVTRTDVSRLVTEAEWVDNALTAAAARAKAGAAQPPHPALSHALEDFMIQNQLTFGTSLDRTNMIKQLRILKDKVPTIHMTFAVTADRESLEQLAGWIRKSIHPQAVISVGLQPALVAGVYLRTPNHVHDLSVRTLLKGQHSLLTKELEALRGRS